MRFKLYGLVAKQQESNTQVDTTEADQREDGDTLIYETDDPKEARAIGIEGGFMRGNDWNVVTRVVDSEAAPVQSIPDAPERPR